MKQGIVVGCDRNQEWLLPWWWKHYSEHNTYPVVFMDFGLSPEALAWCKERGTCVDLSTVDPKQFLKIPESPIKEKWESRCGPELWNERHAWFKKPFACFYSPFESSIWLDLDCEVRGDLAPIFNCLGLGAEIAISKESQSIQELHQNLGFLLPGEINYNSGVIAFKKGAAIDFWLEQTVCHNEQFIGDQQALSRAIFLKPFSLVELPAAFNWSPAEGQNDQATIVHYHGGHFKQEIANQLNVTDLSKSF